MNTGVPFLAVDRGVACPACEEIDPVDRWFLGEPLHDGSVPQAWTPFVGIASADRGDADVDDDRESLSQPLVLVVSMLGMIAWMVASTAP